MAEFGGEVRMVERSNEPHAVKELIDLESQGYKGRQQIAVATQPGEAEYFEEMCTQFAEDGRLVLTALAAGDRFIAYSSCFLAGDQIFLGKVTYDESFSSFSPGNQLQYDTIDYFGARHDFRLLDSCTYPGNKTFTGIYPDRRGIATFIIGLGSPVERMLLRAMPTARRLRSALRSAD